ncbi:MAG: efflux RND transporter periplasmic adaptor subunit, partial [Burkholderiales bacterium]
VWAIAGGKLAKRVVVAAADDDDNGLIELKSALPPDLPELAARFDNLKEGASVLVRSTLAPSASRPG